MRRHAIRAIEEPPRCRCGALATDQWGIMCAAHRAEYDAAHKRDFRQVAELLNGLRRKPRRTPLLNATIPGNAVNTEGE